MMLACAVQRRRRFKRVCFGLCELYGVLCGLRVWVFGMLLCAQFMRVLARSVCDVINCAIIRNSVNRLSICINTFLTSTCRHK